MVFKLIINLIELLNYHGFQKKYGIGIQFIVCFLSCLLPLGGVLGKKINNILRSPFMRLNN